jgi:hypothetical protein
VAAKTSGDAYVSIVQRYVVGTEQRGEGSIQHLGKPAAVRFACDDHPGSAAKLFTDSRQVGIRKLMQNQVSDDHRVIVVPRKTEQIFLVPPPISGPIRWPGPKVEACGGNAASRQPRAEFAGARSDFKYAFAWAQKCRNGSLQPAVRTDHLIRETKIPPVVQGIGMIVGKGIEQFGLKDALHAGETRRWSYVW